MGYAKKIEVRSGSAASYRAYEASRRAEIWMIRRRSRSLHRYLAVSGADGLAPGRVAIAIGSQSIL